MGKSKAKILTHLGKNEAKILTHLGKNEAKILTHLGKNTYPFGQNFKGLFFYNSLFLKQL